MKRISTLALFGALLISQQSISQSYYQDAINLCKFRTYVERVKSQPGVNFDSALFAEELAKSILKMESDEFGPAAFAEDPGAMGFEDLDVAAGGVPSGFDEFQINLVKAEIEQYFKYTDPGFIVFSPGCIPSANDFPASFQYLSEALNIMESVGSAALPTSGALSSLVGVSQAEILQGISNWALKRAQEELMQAFLREWLEKITTDSLLVAMFPNTINVLSSADISTIITDGATWKATFQQDLNEMPEQARDIVEIALNKMGNPLDPVIRLELLSALSAGSTIYREINNGKKVDEILLVLASEAFEDTKRTAIIDRGLVGIGSFITALEIEDSYGNPALLRPDAILNMTEAQLLCYWDITYLRQRRQFKKAFNLKDQNAECSFYKDVRANISLFKKYITQVSSNFNAIQAMVKEISTSNGMSGEQLRSYMNVSFDVVESSVEIIDSLSPSHSPLAAVKGFKTKYYDGLAYLPPMYDGVKSKDYGKVVLNAINMLIWIRSLVKYDENEAYDYLADITSLEDFDKNLTGNQVGEILARRSSSIEADYPESVKIFNKKLKVLNKNLTTSKSYTSAEIKSEIKRAFQITDDEKKQIISELSLSLDNSTAAVNRYGKLMTNIILAEDSEDISNALEAAAMKTGGYLVRHNSSWSASVTFYPGVAAGREVLKGLTFEDESGKIEKHGYIGVTLPIGIELSKGTNWKGIGAIGLFVQALDLGALLNYSINTPSPDSSMSIANNPEIGFEQVLSPGVYLTLHLANSPITLGGGISYSPDLRNVTVEGVELRPNALHCGVFLAVDLNVFPIWASKKKYQLKTKTLHAMYK